MSEKKERKMTPKGFLHKTTTKAANSAFAFISSYREYLTTGELAPRVSPILAKLDADRAEALAQLKDTEGLAQASLKEISHAVMVHIIESDRTKMEAAQEAAQEAVPHASTVKPWLAVIANEKGEVQTRINAKGEEEDLIKSFEHAVDADRWVDRRLFEGAVDWHGEVSHSTLKTLVVIERLDAIARILKKPRGPSVHVKGKSTKSLGFEHKAKENRFYFSRG